MNQKIRSYSYLVLLIALFSCNETEVPELSEGIFLGEIISSDGEAIYPVYIFENDSLLGISKENNQFSIHLASGQHEILFSAIAYKDKTILLDFEEDYSTEIVLDESSEIGKVYGEFQDSLLFQQNILENNELANWNEQEVIDGVTGATIMEDNYNGFEQAELFLGDSLLGYGDVYGQYWVQLQSGTYPITVESAGFKSKIKIIKVLPETKVYLNFFQVKE
jgi:hypothetical protein